MRVQFAEFVFDSFTRELLCLGEPRKLSPKAFLLLETLIAASPRALTKKDLYRALWGDVFVEEANLSNLITEIRQALHETRKNARLIKTIHGYGYAFAGDVGSAAEPGRRVLALAYLEWGHEELPLRPGKNVIGRSADADVMIASGAVSRAHAQLLLNGPTAILEDLGSKNGTFVGEDRLTAPVEIRDGAQVRFGTVAVVFRIVDQTASTRTEMPADS